MENNIVISNLSVFLESHKFQYLKECFITVELFYFTRFSIKYLCKSGFKITVFVATSKK